MIIKDGTDSKIEGYKKKLGLEGDVYMVGHFIESLESHKKLIPNSTATTIEEAEVEREKYEEDLETARLKAVEDSLKNLDLESGNEY